MVVAPFEFVPPRVCVLSNSSISHSIKLGVLHFQISLASYSSMFLLGLQYFVYVCCYVWLLQASQTKLLELSQVHLVFQSFLLWDFAIDFPLDCVPSSCLATSASWFQTSWQQKCWNSQQALTNAAHDRILTALWTWCNGNKCRVTSIDWHYHDQTMSMIWW